VLKQIAVTNLSEQQQWLEAGMGIGEIHEVDKISDGDSPVAMIAGMMAEEERSKQKELVHVVKIKKFVGDGEWAVTDVSENERTGIAGLAMTGAQEKSSEHVTAANQVVAGVQRPKKRSAETAANQAIQEKAGESDNPEEEEVTLRRSTRTRRTPDRYGPSGEAAVGAIFYCWAFSDHLWGYNPVKKSNTSRS
jgi:hypothetical protein